MADNSAAETTVDTDAPLVRQGGYIENPDHTPNPLYQYGTVETTDFGATPSAQMEAASPVFAAARAENLANAARALDPDDPMPAELVVLPASKVTVEGADRTADEAREEVRASVARLAENPVVLGVSPGALEAMKGTSPEDVDDELTDEEVARQDAKTDAQEAERERLAALREGETTSTGATSTTADSSTTSTTGAGTSTTSTTKKPSTTTAAKASATKSTESK